VLKRIRFATPASASLDAPPDVRPVRVARCTVLPDLTPDAKHDDIGLEWFRDADHLDRYETWLVDDGPVVVAEEHVLRGADWLARRWRAGGEKLKHMAIARRAAGLSQAQFQELWRTRAGTVGATPIPDAAKGLAYVQNHPVPRPDGEWAYDAVNEVWFDDIDGLRTRMAWFAERLGDGTEDDLVGESWFVAVREQVLSSW
jgi:hypothetical protein